MGSFVTCAPHQILVGLSNHEKWDGRDTQHSRGNYKCIQNIIWNLRREETTWKTQAWRENDNIKMDLREIGWGNVDWMHLAQWRFLVNTVMIIRVP